MMHQIVRPAGAERETRWVLVVAAVIFAGSVLTVGLRSPEPSLPGVAAYQIESRTGLNAAEQGIYADLKSAVADIADRRGEDFPSPEDLARDALPPFASDLSARARGGHVWTLHGQGDHAGYLGTSSDSAVAGSLFLLFPGHDAEPQIWIWHGKSAPAFAAEPAALIAAGWRQVVSSFIAGVTR